MKGLDQFNDVLDLIRNVDKYEAKVKELKTQYDTIKEASAQLGDLRMASAIRDTAESLLEKARNESKVLKDAFDKEVKERKEILDNEFKKAEAKLEEAQKLQNQVSDLAKGLDVREKAVEKKESAVNKKESELAKYAESLKDKEVELEERLSKLRSVMNG